MNIRLGEVRCVALELARNCVDSCRRDFVNRKNRRFLGPENEIIFKEPDRCSVKTPRH